VRDRPDALFVHPHGYRASHARRAQRSRRRSPERRDRWRCAVHRRRTSQSSGVGVERVDLLIFRSAKWPRRGRPSRSRPSILSRDRRLGSAYVFLKPADRRALGRCSQAICERVEGCRSLRRLVSRPAPELRHQRPPIRRVGVGGDADERPQAPRRVRALQRRAEEELCATPSEESRARGYVKKPSKFTEGARRLRSPSPPPRAPEVFGCGGRI